MTKETKWNKNNFFFKILVVKERKGPSNFLQELIKYLDVLL